MIFNKVMINGEVIFDINSNELYSRTDRRETVTLNAPTARCLKLLLESKGKIISRDEFLSEVWNARGIVVSQNTFYQNISLLRKSLEKAGLAKNIIITVRHRGFALASDTDIIECPDQEVVLHNPQLGDKFNTSINESNIDIQDDTKLISHNVKLKTIGSFNISKSLLLLLVVMLIANVILLIFNFLF